MADDGTTATAPTEVGGPRDPKPGAAPGAAPSDPVQVVIPGQPQQPSAQALADEPNEIGIVAQRDPQPATSLS